MNVSHIQKANISSIYQHTKKLKIDFGNKKYQKYRNKSQHYKTSTHKKMHDPIFMKFENRQKLIAIRSKNIAPFPKSVTVV